MILLLRHGQTKANAGPAGGERLRAHDTPLTHAGRQAAQTAASAAHGAPLVKVLSSPLVRAKETADVWGKHAGVPVETRDDLRARDMGALEGKPVSAVRNILDQMAKRPEMKPPGNGESVNTFVERYGKAVEPLIQAKELYGVVGHGSGVKAIELHHSGDPLTKWNKEPVIAPGQFALVTKDGIHVLEHDGMDSGDAHAAPAREGATSS
jgi:broad specificity phosphatase PhoE